MAINVDKLRSAQSIFFIYSISAFLLIMIFRFIFPGAAVPIALYSRNWRFINGIIDVVNLFPAIAFSALVIPFGIASYEENYKSFSDVFFKHLVSSVITAIAAAAIYAIIFFLVLPMAIDKRENMAYSGDMYRLAKKGAQESKDSGQWQKASQYLDICDHIWYKSPELESLRKEIATNLKEDTSEKTDERTRARATLAADHRILEVVPLSEDQNPVNAVEAIKMSQEAFKEERYFDAHWLANLGTRLAEKGSVEAANAAHLASDAWNKIASLDPTEKEKRKYELYNLKLSGYKAMEMGDWIRAFYIFQELLTYTPDDPDAKKFIAASEKNAKEIAFFTEEMGLSLGENLNGAIFSLPKEDGRVVLRFNSLTTSDDVAYGVGFEYIEFDANMTPKSSVVSQYAKLTPFNYDEKHQVLVLIHA